MHRLVTRERELARLEEDNELVEGVRYATTPIDLGAANADAAAAQATPAGEDTAHSPVVTHRMPVTDPISGTSTPEMISIGLVDGRRIVLRNLPGGWIATEL
jgi:hypothetical protein